MLTDTDRAWLEEVEARCKDATRTFVDGGDVAAMANEIARLTSALADMTAERDAAQQSARHERGTKEAFYIKYLVENKKTFKLDVHLQKARGQRDALKAERDALKAERDAVNKRAEAAERDITKMLRMIPPKYCKRFCKHSSAQCVGECSAEWRGPDAQHDT